MIFKACYFDELTPREVYEILKARAQIFVVEQNCTYQDMDGVDYHALHVFFEEENGTVIAYMRAFFEEKGSRAVKVGRVLTLEHGKGFGSRLLEKGIPVIQEKMNAAEMVIDAQCHAIGFYERAGFAVCSDEFLEVGIPHVKMRLAL